MIISDYCIGPVCMNIPLFWSEKGEVVTFNTHQQGFDLRKGILFFERNLCTCNIPGKTDKTGGGIETSHQNNTHRMSAFKKKIKKVEIKYLHTDAGQKVGYVDKS